MPTGKRMEVIMANRPVFIAVDEKNKYVKEKNIEFEWFPGFSINQKQKSINSLHENFLVSSPSSKILEVSSKSDKNIGIALSAFYLKVRTKKNKEFSVETAFQASKVFEFGGPYLDLYKKTSKEAKKDTRIKNSGKLLYFEFFNRKWDLEPKTLFYDWLYINALSLNPELSGQVINYDAFTDIEFNPSKSFNCQARSVALYVSLYKSGLLKKALSSVESYKDIIVGDLKEIVEKEELKEHEAEQLSIFDEIINN
jgi:hypothetical protein